MERTKGLKEYIQTKEYRESLGLSGQVTETYTMLAQENTTAIIPLLIP